MSRKKYGLTEYRILRFEREGRGLGTGTTYIPWFLVSDLSSKGRSHRIYWWKTDRVHHLFSDIEFLAFLFLIWGIWAEVEEAEDIREQFPLPRQETIRIAKTLGVRHPVDPYSQTLWVVTTDFVVTVATPQGLTLFAIAAKPEKSLNKASVLKKLEIERRFWEERQVPWFLVTDTQVKNQIGMNLLWIFDGSCKPNHKDDLERTIFSLLAKERLTHPCVPMKMTCKLIDHQLSFPEGTALGALRRMLAWKWVTVDLNAVYLQDLPMSEFSFREVPKHVYTHDFDC